MSQPQQLHRSKQVSKGALLSRAAVVVVALAIAAGCTSSNSETATSSTISASASTADWAATPCTRPVAATPKVAAVPGVKSDWDLTSFDGTTIRLHWFPVDGSKPSPTVLMGPGWGLPGSTDTTSATSDATSAMSVLSISTLREAGYNVLTWDPRGFGDSGGTVEIDSASFEAADASRLLDWVATRPGVLLDSKGDPRVGMVGASYGGGIQLVTAATDCRIDAITPTIAWHSLGTSLYKAETVKAGWAGVLIKIAADHQLDQHILDANEAGMGDGVLSPADRQWFLNRGPGNLVNKIQVPTLIVQGTVDNLFTLDEGIDNYLGIAKSGAPLSMLWYCGGHGICLTPTAPAGYVSKAVMAWLDRYVKGNTSAPIVPEFQTVDQNGNVHKFESYPVDAGPTTKATGSGNLTLGAQGGSGPAKVPTHTKDVVAGIAAPITPSRATNAVDVTIANSSKQSRLLLGAPSLTLRYSGEVYGETTKPTRVFAQLVDSSTGLVVGNQVTPIDVTLDGKTHTTTIPLETIVFDAKPGAKLTLQIVASTVAYATPHLGGSVDFNSIVITLPSAKD